MKLILKYGNVNLQLIKITLNSEETIPHPYPFVYLEIKKVANVYHWHINVVSCLIEKNMRNDGRNDQDRDRDQKILLPLHQTFFILLHVYSPFGRIFTSILHFET